jgi:hypothetical protein
VLVFGWSVGFEMAVIDGWSAWAVPHALQEETAAVLVKIIIPY